MTDDRLHLACVTDDGYAPWCAAMLHSALANRTTMEMTVHLLHPRAMAPEVLDGLGSVVEAGGGAFRPSAIAADEVAHLPGTDYFPSIIWYRSLLPDLRPELDRVLYLDADTLVTDDLVPLWSTDLAGNAAAAVRNLLLPHLLAQPQRVGIPDGQAYFNSGVLLMDLATMRRDGSVAALHDHGREYEGISLWPDQDALNHVLGGRCLELHPRWNAQNSFFAWSHAADELGREALAEATTSPGILHFEGPPAAKPWHYLSRHPFRDRYWYHLARTPFCPRGPEGRTLRNVVVRHLPPTLEQAIRRGRSRARRAIRGVRP